jgi:hypothetical protein
MAAYCASKHGLIGFTRALAAEVGDKGVTVNALCPGWVDTDMTRQAAEAIAEKTDRPPKHPTAQSVYLAPLVDERQPPRPSPNDAIGYLRDDDWDRDPSAMVQSILTDELRASGLFAAVLDQPAPDAIELVPTLKTFEGGLHEQPFGRRSLARVEIVLQARGPEVDGVRSEILNESFGAQQISNVDFRPPSPRVLLGTGLRSALTKGIAALEAAATEKKPAEASGTKR